MKTIETISFLDTKETIRITGLQALLCHIVNEITDEMGKPHFHRSAMPPKTELKNKLFKMIMDADLGDS